MKKERAIPGTFSRLSTGISNVIYDIKAGLHAKFAKRKSPEQKDYAKIKRSIKLRTTLCIWSFLIIPIINLFIFWVYGTIQSVPIAFEQYSLSGVKTYGLFNFDYIIEAINTPGSIFREAITNTLIYWSFGFFVLMPTSYVIAFFLYKKIAGYKFFRYVFFFPSLLSTVVIAALFKYIIGPNGPVVDMIEKITGEPGFLLLRDSTTALPTLLFFNFYMGLAGNLIYYLAAFARIPHEVTESAILDGANMWQEIIKIVFPLTFPIFGTMMLLNITGFLGSGGAALLLTGGGYKTYDIPFYEYVLTISGNKSSEGIAGMIGLLKGVLTLPVALIINKLVNKIEPIEY